MIKGIVFDKDGTLFDFNATWGVWTRQIVAQEAGDDPALVAALAAALGYDLDDQRFLPDSVVIAETSSVIASSILPLLPATNHEALLTRMNAAAGVVPQVEAVPLVPFFRSLRGRGLTCGVATNDAEAPARVHLSRAGIINDLTFVAGYDSGFGGKPAPGQLLAFCGQTGLAPDACAMVGDSLHDLRAGRAAGMTTIGVLTGPANRAELTPVADVVLPSIADIPGWLDG